MTSAQVELMKTARDEINKFFTPTEKKNQGLKRQRQREEEESAAQEITTTQSKETTTPSEETTAPSEESKSEERDYTHAMGENNVS